MHQRHVFLSVTHPVEMEPLLAAGLAKPARQLLRLLITWLRHSHFSPQLGPIKQFFSKITHGAGEVAEKYEQEIARKIFSSPEGRVATEHSWRALMMEASSEYSLVFHAFIACLLVLLIVMVAPLLYRLVRRRRLKIFVSFNREREDVAERLTQSLLSDNLNAIRVPYNPAAGHQQIIADVYRGITKCDVFVCIPGETQSFVESEVLAASTAGKPVVFMISEAGGTLPNTADKRYPVLSLEKMTQSNFASLADFLCYVGNDFSSGLRLCKGALLHPLIMRSSKMSRGVLLFMLSLLWTFNFLGLKQSAAFSGGGTLLAHAVVMAALSSTVLIFAVYIIFFCVKYMRQLHVARLTRLRVCSGDFCKSEWRQIISELPHGNHLYASLLESSPLAHHEVV
jgi:hypothetical protein